MIYPQCGLHYVDADNKMLVKFNSLFICARTEESKGNYNIRMSNEVNIHKQR
jgi:hypothetical protein